MHIKNCHMFCHMRIFWCIERNSTRLVPEHEGQPHNIANHVRACLDLIELENYCAAEGMYRDFLDEDDRYNTDVFAHVLKLIKVYPNRFDKINRFMGREYGTKWIFFITSKGYDCLCGMPNKNSFRVPL